MRYLRIKLLLVTILLASLLAISAPAAGPDWFTFQMPWDDGSPSFVNFPADTSADIDARGFVGIGPDGHFQFETGQRARFFGIVFGPGAAFPSHENAEKTAQRLAKLGFNLVKFSGIDRVLLSGTDPVAIDPIRLEKLFYLIWQLRQNGIYVAILLVTGEGWLHPGYFFDQELIDRGKEYLRQLLVEEVNPYTGLPLADDPVLAFVEVINETSLFSSFQACQLHTEDECSQQGAQVIPLTELSPPPKEWPWRIPVVPEHVTDVQSEDLDQIWNDWLQRHYNSRDELEQAWAKDLDSNGDWVDCDLSAKKGLQAGEDPFQNTVERVLYAEWNTTCFARLIDTLTFYFDLERDYISCDGTPNCRTSQAAQMKDFLKTEVGLRVPIATILNFYGMADKIVQADMDYMDQHVQWEHPWRWEQFGNPPFDYLNTPEVKGETLRPADTPGWIETRSTIWKAVVTSAVQGKPYVVSEYNHYSTNEFQAEFPLIIASYASFQDWDGIILHAYGSQIGSGMLESGFELADNPAVMAQIPAAARVFRNGWIRKALQTINIPFWSEGALWDWWKCRGDYYCYWEAGNLFYPKQVNPAWSLVHKVQNEFVEAETPSPSPGEPTTPYVSDTGELTWNMDRGLVKVDAPKVQATIGFVGSAPIQLSSMKIDATTDFAAVSLVPLDGSPIAVSQKLLLTAASRHENTNMQKEQNPDGTWKLIDWGQAPVLLQPVMATVTLTLPQASIIHVYRLNACGGKDTPIDVQKTGDDKFTFDIGEPGIANPCVEDPPQWAEHNTLWYGIVVEPPDTAAVYRVTREGDVLADKAYHGTDFLTGGADVAEHINVSEPVEPGDVVELDPQHPGYYRKARSPYSTLAAGVISSRPAVTMGQLSETPTTTTTPLSIPQTALSNLGLAFAMSAEHRSQVSFSALLTDNLSPGPLTFDVSLSQLLNYLPPSTGAEGKPLLALMGVVPVKATTENGPIQPGDLLVPSSIAGYVMRCDDLRRCEGAIVGKALEPLEKRKGIIQMLVMR